MMISRRFTIWHSLKRCENGAPSEGLRQSLRLRPDTKRRDCAQTDGVFLVIKNKRPRHAEGRLLKRFPDTLNFRLGRPSGGEQADENTVGRTAILEPQVLNP